MKCLYRFLIKQQSLTVKNLKIFLPFTINLDPYIKKLIKEEIHNMEALGVPILSESGEITLKAPITPQERRSTKLFSKKKSIGSTIQRELIPLEKKYIDLIDPSNQPPDLISEICIDFSCIPTQFKSQLLSSLTVPQVCDLVNAVGEISDEKSRYCMAISKHNINGKVLQHCEIPELKNVIGMNFGDWEMFKMMLVAMRNNEVRTENVQASEPLTKKVNKGEEKKILSHRRESVIKQVAMEEEAVSGLLAFINEDAREDYMQEEEEGTAVLDINVKTNPQEVECIYYSNVERSVQDIHKLPDTSGFNDQARKFGNKQVPGITSVPKLYVNGEDVKHDLEMECTPHVRIGHGKSSPFLRRERSSSFFNRERSQSECPDFDESEETEPAGVMSMLNHSMNKIFESRKKKQDRHSFTEFYLEPSDSVIDLTDFKADK